MSKEENAPSKLQLKKAWAKGFTNHINSQGATVSHSKALLSHFVPQLEKRAARFEDLRSKLLESLNKDKPEAAA